MFIFKRMSKRIKSVSVDKSQLDGYDIDLLINFKGSKKSIALAMPVEEAVIFRDELDMLIKEAKHEEVL